MEQRPKSFYGYEDYSYGNPQDDIDRIERDQKEWDVMYHNLPFWRKLIYNMFGV